MTIEAAKEFLKKAREDHALYARLSAIEGNNIAAVKLGAEFGYTFTASDLGTASDELSGDLSDDDLAAAAGGLGGMNPPVIFPPS